MVANFAEGHGHGVVEEHSVDQPVTDAGDQLDRLGGLDGADDPRERREDADVLGFFDGSRRRWLGIEAAIAAAARDEHRHLTFDAKDAAVHERFAKQVGRVAEEVARAKGVGAVDDDVVPSEQLHRIVFVDGLLDRLHLDVRIQGAHRPSRAGDLRPVQSLHRVDDLSLKIGKPDMVMVGEPDRADARRCQVERDGGAQRAHADDQHARTQQTLLAFWADLREREVAGVALSLLGREGALGHQAPLGLAGTAWKMPWKTCGSRRRRRRQSASVCEAKTSRAACSACSVTCPSTRLSPVCAPSGCRLFEPFPSRQSITWSRRISCGGLASSCPPCGPRVEVMKPARRRIISTWSRNGPGIPCRRAISLLWRAPRPAWLASSRTARTPYSVFIEKRIRTAVDP